MSVGDTKLDIWNKAVQACGSAGEISDDDEESRPAELCRQWYSEVVSVVQEAAWWPTSRKVTKLASRTDETIEEYQFSFRLPTDFFMARYLTSGMPFHVDDRLLTNDGEPVLVYSFINEDPGKWPPAQTRATIFALASKLARPLTGHRELSATLEGQANYLLREAQASEANKQEQTETVPDWIVARHGGSPSVRFSYPIGDGFQSYTSGPASSQYKAFPRASVF